MNKPDTRLVDEKFAELMAGLCEQQYHDVVFQLARTVSADAGVGHSCSLYQTLDISEKDLGQLAESVPVLVKTDAGNISTIPLLFDGERLFLNKLYQSERVCEKAFLDMAQTPLSVDAQGVSKQLEGLPFMGEVQVEAVIKALSRRLAIITGGPGTGKTTLVIRLLAMLIQSFHEAGRQAHIAIVAPTGKASARLKESIELQKQAWLENLCGFDEKLIASIPSESSTLQALLAIHPGHGKALYNASRPLKYDVIVVDEASMIDLVLMRQLLEAIKPGGRLVLLGDPFQLASVEAGSVLSRLVKVAENENSPLHACVSCLLESHRFKKAPAIGSFADAVNSGDVEMAREVLVNKEHEQVRESGLEQALEQAIEGYTAYKIFLDQFLALNDKEQADKLPQLFRLFNQWQVFSPFRSGRYGVARLNQLVEKGLGFPGHEAWYVGRPVMISENDHVLKLFNGDIGLMLDPNCRMVTFPDGMGGFRHLPISQLPAHETVFAMTVHKSQGSEFEQCQLIVTEPGDRQAGLLTREILYTAVTRAKSCFYLHARPDLLALMINTPTQRNSGLFC